MTIRKGLATLLVAGLIGTALGGNAVAAPITDPAGDFLATYVGPQNGDLDVLNADVSIGGGHLKLSATLNGSVGTTATGFYVFGLNRGRGTERFQLGAAPHVGAGVSFDSVLIIRPNGTGNFNDLITPANSHALSAADIHIHGTSFSGDFALSNFATPPGGLIPDLWTWNLWPRDGGAGNAHISDFAPDASNASVAPEPSSLLLCTVGGLFLAGMARRRKAI
jgi:hypothetical protein